MASTSCVGGPMSSRVFLGATVMLSLALGACGPADAQLEYTYVQGEGDDYVLALAPGETANEVMQRLGSPAPQILYLNFEGGVIFQGGWSKNNAQTNTSFIPAVNAAIPAFNAGYWGGDRGAAEFYVAVKVAQAFGGYQVTVTTERPNMGDYTMIMIGGTAGSIGKAGAYGGLSPLDPGNTNKSDVGFVFSDTVGAYGYNLDQLAWTIAHEFAHTLGLRHISPTSDIMNAVSCHCSQGWGAGPTTDGSGGYQDDWASIGSVISAGAPIPVPDYRTDSRVFNAGFYLAQYPDLRAALGANNYAAATSHWKTNGIYEGRRGGPAFYSRFYLSHYGDLRTAFGANNYAAALKHFVVSGIAEGRAGCEALDVRYYLGKYGDLRSAFGATGWNAALIHWLNGGIAEGRQGSPVYSGADYLARYGDLRNAFGARGYSSALFHWYAGGIAEGRQASATFDPRYYLAHNADVAKAVGSTNWLGAIWHYLNAGKTEGRIGAP